MFADPIDHAVNSSGEAPRAAGMPHHSQARFNQPAQFKSGLQPPTAEPGASGDLQGRALRTAVSSKSMPRL
jgi:hypothetical protein